MWGVKGEIQAFWREDRVLLLLGAKVSGGDDDTDGRFYMRALGPQIRLVSTVENELETRAIAAKLGS